MLEDRELGSRQQQRRVAALTHHAQRLAHRRWRQLVWLSGDAVQCRALAKALWQAYAWQAPLWVGDENAPLSPLLSPRKARMRLGAEHQLSGVGDPCHWV
ncbi:hypothetical protein HSBAA_54220 [Vreelandella sulfidaeris]|uniref:TmcA/NAT10 N-terminal domain-containing protein n=1 Tax=Vreelandella sulfidaeris TaxID=115553 RepID=A0A455UD15_9GAMM|nr:hypothetical protein HSBAA_54220 [Halomonas sulfidaeris]